MSKEQRIKRTKTSRRSDLAAPSLLGKMLILIPIIGALFVWLSPLSFVPVPWPDDSAFYFVARDFFKWPPRWVMIPQSPFEPTYRIFNFNTMPLYPMIIGLGRFIGIDGSFAIKFWPLLGWALSGSLCVAAALKRGLPRIAALILALLFALDPALRWASVLVRPESMIGLCGVAIVLGITLGFPKRFEVRGRFWDPIAALLAIGALLHFNAVYLVFPVIAAFVLTNPRRLLQIGLKTGLYLTPWLLTVALHPQLFVHQMKTQWTRLSGGNDWLHSFDKAVGGLFQSMGSPEPWHPIVYQASILVWLLLLIAMGLGINDFINTIKKKHRHDSLAPAAAWILSSCWLWNSKPEVWFTYYIHISLLCFLTLALLRAFNNSKSPTVSTAALKGTLSLLGLGLVLCFSVIDSDQLSKMSRSPSWRWETYGDFVDCVDKRLTELETTLQTTTAPAPKPFRVWCPTFPDITIELSRRHPDWELTRTNDFWERVPLALQHGRDVEAVVVTESINPAERLISSPASEHPEIQSVWMTWKGYFLHNLYDEPGWKPNRYYCQRGKWQAFIFMK